MKITLFFYLLSFVLFNSSVFANVVAKEVHPDKKKFSKTPVSDSINQSDFYVGSQFDYDRDGIPDKVEINGISKYRFIEGRFTWLQAKSDAISKGGYLASITSDTENKKVAKISGNRSSWIGGSDYDFEGRWNWVTGERFEFENWAKNEPNNSSNSEDCLEILKDGKWNDAVKSKKQGYILEIKIKTNPNLADSDGDGYTDRIEINENSDPRDRNSVPYKK